MAASPFQVEKVSMEKAGDEKPDSWSLVMRGGRHGGVRGGPSFGVSTLGGDLKETRRAGAWGEGVDSVVVKTSGLV